MKHRYKAISVIALLTASILYLPRAGAYIELQETRLEVWRQEKQTSLALQIAPWLNSVAEARGNPTPGITEPTLPDIVASESSVQGVPVPLIRALMYVESKYNKDAIAFNPEGDAEFGRMRSAAHSYMQVRGTNVGTAMCPEAKVWSDLYKPQINIKCGVRILKAALKHQPSVYLALAEYNGGYKSVRNGKVVYKESEQHAQRVLEKMGELYAENKIG